MMEKNRNIINEIVGRISGQTPFLLRQVIYF